MTILEYIDKYSDKSFKEEKFNEVDNVIFSAISYIDFKDIVSSNAFNKIKISVAANKYFNLYKKNTKTMAAYKTAIAIFSKIRNTKRYKDLLLYNYCYIGNKDQQFSAITIEIDKTLLYIAYEGTDNLVSGWEEDFRMSYMFPVKAQRNAINYINRNIFSRKNIIIGGHSKGGNLALVAGMYANRFVKRKIINIYSNDGPGLRKSEFISDNYKFAALKLISIIPSSSIVGLLFRHSNKYKVIHSNKKGPLAHDLITWEVDDKEFKRDELSKYSKIFDVSMKEWLNKYSYSEREEFTRSLFDIFRKLGVDDLEEFISNKKLILKLIIGTKNIPKQTRGMMKDFISVMYEYFKEYKKN